MLKGRRVIYEPWWNDAISQVFLIKLFKIWLSKTEIKFIFWRDATIGRIVQIKTYLVNYFEGYLTILIVISTNLSCSIWQIYWKKWYHIYLLANFPRYFKLAIFRKTSGWRSELLLEVKGRITARYHILICYIPVMCISSRMLSCEFSEEIFFKDISKWLLLEINPI